MSSYTFRDHPWLWRLLLVAPLAISLVATGCDRVSSVDELVADKDDERDSDDDEEDENEEEEKEKAKEDEKDEEVESGEDPEADTKAGASSSAKVKPSPPEKSFFEDLAPAIEALRAKVGASPVKALQLVVYAEYVHLRAQDPKDAESVHEYRYRDGSVGKPKPVRLTGKSDQAALEKSLFSLDDVDFNKLPGMVEDAKKRFGSEKVEVSHIILKRPLPFATGVHWRVYVKSPSNSGSVQYDTAGKMTKEYK
jgi:hypothetical protein